MDDSPFRWPLIQAAGTQTVFLVVASVCIMDLGTCTIACLLVAIPFWIVAFFLRGSNQPSHWSVWFVQWGLIPMTLVGVPLVHPLIGYFLQLAFG